METDVLLSLAIEVADALDGGTTTSSFPFQGHDQVIFRLSPGSPIFSVSRAVGWQPRTRIRFYCRLGFGFSAFS